ncbi:UDP-glucose 4-epimerase GalE [Azonexus hydrophilus]|uniref:UDP-glucose 4-epimerase n=1 Tax=Azonexus hydrophilus TaxID=418702 RepID=A0A1R1I7Y4_9RHOO|nr:UDP-glucose 4-epimerase GalE [Azonexus hydrophilus]OMG54868.1 UDP-glucose 4-epimerase GalE [Azonexus hydrophilus]
MTMILVTGGTGYIGSHTVVELLARGEQVLILDNLCNSSLKVLERIESITGKRPGFVKADIRDKDALQAVFNEHRIGSVVHFAGLKAVGESVAQPLAYYDNNVSGTANLLQVMAEAGVRRLVFSSSATVYGDPHTVPIREDFPLHATNPYGRTKLMIEEMLRDLALSDPTWRIAILRYFNPVGAHASGLIGESPNGVPNNLMPFVAQVALGRRTELSVFGSDYPTSDGTGVRDYIHVVDLALGHLAALDELARSSGTLTVNLGTGQGYSVLDMVRAFEQASGRSVPYRLVDRRPGDIASCYADPVLAEKILGWRAKRSIGEMCADTWRWQAGNPEGL